MWGSEVHAGVQVAEEARGLRSPRGGADRAGVLPWIGLGATLGSPARVLCAYNHLLINKFN